MDMNADPFERVKLVAIFAELFYGNLLEFVGGPATITARRMRMYRFTFVSI